MHINLIEKGFIGKDEYSKIAKIKVVNKINGLHATTPVFEENMKWIMKGKTILINRGGTRSSKTFSIMQIFECLLTMSREEIRQVCPKLNTGSEGELVIDRPLRATVTRDVYTDLAANALEDFKTWIEMNGTKDDWKELKSQGNHHFTHRNGNKIYFKAFRYEDNAKGFKSDFILQNEGNTQALGVARQLRYRLTSGGLHFIDFNPDSPDVWINTQFEQSTDEGLRSEMVVIQSSYLNNCFLGKEQKDTIERLKNEDINYWHIYGTGEYGIISNKIFHNYVEYDTDKLGNFDDLECTDEILGMDFGSAVPTSLVHVKRWEVHKFDEERDLHTTEHHVACKCVLYKKDMLPSEIAKAIISYQTKHNIHHVPLVADPAGRVEIRELQNHGIPILKVKKIVRDNIQNMRKFKMHIVNEDITSSQLLKELNNYKNKENKDGEVIDFTPIKQDDHAVDGLKYALYNWKYLHD